MEQPKSTPKQKPKLKLVQLRPSTPVSSPSPIFHWSSHRNVHLQRPDEDAHIQAKTKVERASCKLSATAAPFVPRFLEEAEQLKRSTELAVKQSQDADTIWAEVADRLSWGFSKKTP